MNYLVLFLVFITPLIFMGCSHTSDLSRPIQHKADSEVNYSVIYYIHSDSDYLYHNPDGERIEGNSKVLAAALEIGKSARSGEVFVYYQRPERRLLGLFPKRSSRLYYFRNGHLINRVKYRHPDKREAFLSTEAQLLNQVRTQNQTHDHRNFFLFFGHEISSEPGGGYHRTLPGIDVNVDSFASGIQNFLLSDEDRFDLVVISSCNNGTPAMAELLIPFTDVMLASPQNLHLSHFDSDSLALLETEPRPSSLQLGRSIAEQTYQRLETSVKTTLTISLYDLKDIGGDIHKLSSLVTAKNTPEGYARFQDNTDCAEIIPSVSENYGNGVETWFKPARFGRQPGRSGHSGWGCKPVTEH